VARECKRLERRGTRAVESIESESIVLLSNRQFVNSTVRLSLPLPQLVFVVEGNCLLCAAKNRDFSQEKMN
jgi:hypothetical protein